MAIKIEFTGQGSELLASIQSTLNATKELREQVAATNEATTKGAQQSVAAQEKYTTAVDAAVSATAELNKQATSGGTAKLATDLDKSAAAADRMGNALTEAQTATFSQTITAVKEVAKQEGVVVKELAKEKAARVDALVAVKALSSEEAKLVKEATQLVDAFEGVAPVVNEGTSASTSLRSQLKAAKDEAAAMIAQFGEFSPQAIEATRRAAELKDQIGDLNQRIDSLNPDSGGLGAFAKFGNVLTNGAQAVGGFFTAFGVGEGKLQEAALQLQSFVLGVQGAKEFVGGLNDALKDIRIALGLATTAQVAQTTATEADVVAKGAQTAANTTAATSTGVLTGAVRVLTTALLANPLIAFVAALAAVGVAIVALSDDTDGAAERFDKLNSELDETIRKRQILRDAGRTLADLDAEAAAIRGQGTLAERRANIESAGIRRNADLEQQRAEQALRLEAAKIRLLQITQQITEAINSGNGFALNGLQEELEKVAGNVKDAKEALFQTNVEIVANGKTTANQLAQFDKDQKKEAIDNAKQLAAETLAVREQLAKELLEVEKTINERVKALAIEQADPKQKLALQRQAAEDEIEVIRQNLLSKQALIELEKQIGIKAFQELSDAQRDARANALVNEGDVKLSVEQEKQFQTLSLATWDKYYNELEALDRENTQARLELLTDINERERQALDIELADKAEKLRLAGATQAEIEAFTARKREELSRTQAERSRGIEEQIAIARVEAIKAGGDQSADAQKAAELKILQIKLEAAKVSLDLVGQGTDQETQKRKADLEKLIAELQQSITTLRNQREPIDLFSLLGISFKTAEQKKAVEDAIASVIDLARVSIQAQADEVEAQITATDQLIADRERRSEDLEQRLQQEIELAKLGLANNVDAIRAEIAENEKAAVAEKARKQKLLEDQKRIAKQQLAIDAAVQASALITTGANLLANESLKGIVGAIAAIGFFASVFAAFAALKARAAAINSGGPQLERGGTTEGMVKGRSHAEGGLGIYDERSGKRVAEMEGGEFVINKHTSRRHRRLVEAVNKNDISRVADLAIAELMGSYNITLDRSEVDKAVDTKTQYIDRTTVIHQAENEALRKEVRQLTKVVKSFQNQQAVANETETIVGADGTIVMKEPGITRTIRRA